jgi:sugar lactone lactonase YvrE
MKNLLIVLAVLSAGPLARADQVFIDQFYDPAVNGPVIREFNPDGSSFIFASSGLSGPNGLAFNSAGSLFVANVGNNTVVSFDSSGNPTLFSNSGLNQPEVLAFDNNNDLYVANAGNGNGYIERYDAQGNASLFATGLYQPQGIACDNFGNVYVSTWINNQTGLAILKYTPGGQVSTFVTWDQPSTHFGLPRGLAFYNGNLYCTDGNSLDRITLSGQFSLYSTFNLTNSIGVALDSSGNAYVTDQQGGYVMKYNTSHQGSVFASGYNEYGLTYVAVAPVPEPATMGIIAAGVIALARKVFPRRKKL